MFERFNDAYGHTAVLARYAGLREPRPVAGMIQHGWTSGPAMNRGVAVGSWSKLYWGERGLYHGWTPFRRTHHLIGSPFIYVDHEPLREQPIPKSLLVAPFHSAEEHEIEGDFAHYADWIEQFAKEQGYAHVGVCLYWREYEDDTLRALFADKGFEVMTAGHRDHNDAFIPNLVRMMTRFEHVCSNRVATFIFYALYLGIPSFIHGPGMGLHTPLGLAAAEDYDAWQREHFPELMWENFSGQCERQTALEELGERYKRSPAELRALLGWNKRGYLLEPAHRAERRLHDAPRKVLRVYRKIKARRRADL